MNIYPTPNIGVTTDDVLLGSAGDTGANGDADTGQIWRVRAQAGANVAANGWSSLPPIGTQGTVFDASTVGYNGINISFDWYATNQGEANLQLEYTPDGTTWHNAPITLSAADSGLAALANSSSANTVQGSYVSITGGAGQDWFPHLTATISDPNAANDPNFGIKMVNASTGADNISTSGTPLNNNSGNWRFDNVTISGTAITAATPEPATLVLFGTALVALLTLRWRTRVKRLSFPRPQKTQFSNCLSGEVPREVLGALCQLAAAQYRESGEADAEQRERGGLGHCRCKHRDAARIRETHRAGIHCGGTSERHENLTVERVDRDRVRARGHRQVDGLGNHAPQRAVRDHVEEPSGVAAITASDVELVCRRVVPQLVRATEPGERLDDRAGARGIEQDRSRPAAANQ